MGYFADCLASALMSLGAAVRIFDFQKEGEEGLKALSGRSFRAVIDFNSKLPRVRIDDVPLTELIDAPFFDWILDHPLYHHDVLKAVRLSSDFHVLCLDEGHAAYVRKWYPAVRSADMLPLGCSKPAGSMRKRKNRLVFCGTYFDPQEIMRCIENSPDEIRDRSRAMIQLMLADPDMTDENACGTVYGKTGQDFPMKMQMNFLADTYIRFYYREQIIKELADAGVPLDVYGANWEIFRNKFSTTNTTNTMITTGTCGTCGAGFYSEVSYSESLKIQSGYSMVLNMMPWFKAGAHDRVFTAMSGGSMCLTDESDYMEANFEAGKDHVSYDLRNIGEIGNIVCNLLNSPERINEIAICGQEKVMKSHLWVNRASRLLEHIEEAESAGP